MEQVWIELSNLSAKIYWEIVLIFILCGGLLKQFNVFPKVKMVTKTLILGTVATILYVAFMHNEGGIEFSKALLSYALATSIYEILLRKILDKLGINKSYTITTTDEMDYYDAVDDATFDVTTSTYPNDVIVYSNQTIFVKLDDGSYQSNFVGTRPPKKPPRN